MKLPLLRRLTALRQYLNNLAEAFGKLSGNAPQAAASAYRDAAKKLDAIIKEEEKRQND